MELARCEMIGNVAMLEPYATECITIADIDFAIIYAPLKLCWQCCCIYHHDLFSALKQLADKIGTCEPTTADDNVTSHYSTPACDKHDTGTDKRNTRKFHGADWLTE